MNVNLQRELPADTTARSRLRRHARLLPAPQRRRRLEPESARSEVHVARLASSTTQVDNPFFGTKYAAGRAGNGAKTSRAQLLRPYPQFTRHHPDLLGGRVVVLPLAAGDRHQAATRQGLQMQVAYTWGKSLDDGLSHQDSYNIRADRALSDIDVSHRVVIVRHLRPAVRTRPPLRPRLESKRPTSRWAAGR